MQEVVNVKPQPVPQPKHISIVIENIGKQYKRGSNTVKVLSELNLQVPKGEFLALMGPSGSGKSTLLNLIGGIDRPTHGTISVDGLQLDRLSDRGLARWRSDQVGFVFQLYHLLPVLNAEKNVEIPLLLRRMRKSERKKRVDAALSLVGLKDRAKHKPSELSGGQEQRVAIARAIVHNPDLLLCDEPTGDLDRKTGDEILELLKILNEEYGKTVIMVTHDSHAAKYAERTLYVNNGALSVKADL